MTITPATKKDLAAIQAYDLHIPAARLDACVAEGFVYLLRDGERPIGVLRYSLFWQMLPFLDLLYLDEAYRRQGHGTRAMAHWESQMRRAGYTHVLLSTQADEDAQFFYEKLSYIRCGGFTPPGQEAVELVFYKKL